MAEGESEKSLEQTPSWAVAAVCTVFVVASLVVERVLKYLGNYLKKTKQKQLLHTLEQIKDELMLLGFISLSLTVFQAKISSICMPERLNSFMLPCKYRAAVEAAAPTEAGAHRRLLSSGGTVTCPAGKVQVISTEGLHQLHIFIFVMAIVHVIYSAITVLVGLWQVHRWKRWEVQATDAQTEDKCFNKALAGKHVVGDFISCRMRYSCLHTTRSGFHINGYLYSFFRQFGKPIYKSDYLCLRLGFIEKAINFNSFSPVYNTLNVVLSKPGTYIAGVSIGASGFGWYSYFWLAFVPTIMVLFVGAKLQLIITCLAREVRTNVEISPMCKDIRMCKKKDLKKMASVHPRDELFWFNSPKLLLFLVHFILFQNAFELAYFFWTVFTYGYSSCLVGSTWMVIVRILVGFSIQILCSACTLPLYALVTQLGSNIKYSVFKSEATGAALKGWVKTAKKKHNEPNHVHTPPGTPHDSSHDSSSQDSKPHVHTPHEASHAKPHIGILGLTKALDEHGHPVDIPHNGHAHGNGHPHYVHPHGLTQAHPQTHDGFHTVEIGEQPAAAANESSESGRTDEDRKPQV